MRRKILLGLSIITLFASVIGLFYLAALSLNHDASIDELAIALIILAVLLIISAIGIVAFSRTGFRINGSKKEWEATMIINPRLALVHYRNYEEDKVEEKEDWKKD